MSKTAKLSKIPRYSNIENQNLCKLLITRNRWELEILCCFLLLQISWNGIEIKAYDEINDGFCADVKSVYGDKNHHDQVGGLKKMGDQMKNGMVLAMSLWDDHDANMLWLDSNYPVGCNPSTPTDHGCARGPCPIDSGVPADVEANYPDASVTYGKIRVGDIDSTYKDLLY